MFRPRVTWLPPLLLVAAALVPFLGTSYALAFTLTLLSSLVLAQSWDWLGGKTGYTNLGHYAFFGVGAYAFSITVSQGFSVSLGLLAAVLVPVSLALLLSFPLFRLKGNYFAFATSR
jgi:branched-chain amino acid transport system permease protein